MTLVQFLTASGVFAWGWVAWRMFRIMRGLPNRLRWAMWGHKRARDLRRYI
jgi:hypothetical protein